MRPLFAAVRVNIDNVEILPDITYVAALLQVNAIAVNVDAVLIRKQTSENMCFTIFVDNGLRLKLADQSGL